jgi:xanthine dehydrogenase accessory factor
MGDFFEKVAALRREGQPFATATVVGRRAPVSAHLGDRAIVHADGRMEGFVGGACSREIVRKQALECLRLGHARLVSISPDAAAASVSDPEHVIVPMTCVSEGAVDVYVEPNLRRRRLVVAGATPVAEALTRTALTLDYDVVRIVDARERGDLEPQAAALGFTLAPLESLEAVMQEAGGSAVAVVASQGHYDEEALETILRSGAAYVGLVASRTRGATVLKGLHAAGVPGVGAVRNPAGIDLGARTAPEVALSILAEIVQVRPSQALADPAVRQAHGGTTDHHPSNAQPSEPQTAVDPVCHMHVDVATARHTAVAGGTTYYFCCAECRRRFVEDPDRFLASRS